MVAAGRVAVVLVVVLLDLVVLVVVLPEVVAEKVGPQAVLEDLVALAVLLVLAVPGGMQRGSTKYSHRCCPRTLTTRSIHRHKSNRNNPALRCKYHHMRS